MTTLPDSAQRALSVLSETLREGFGEAVTAFLFGSYARGEADETSDLDVLLIVRPELRQEVRRKAAEIVSTLLCEGAPHVSFIIVDVSRWQQPTPFIEEVKRDAVALPA